VALLSQPQAQPDEVLLKLLETQLREQGCRVFVDRPAGVGLEWAAEFQRQVGASDMVVPLLSETSIHSEMLAYEVEIAYQAAQTQQGRPRLLPVRVNYAGPLPFPSALARILEPLPYVLWQSDQDDARLVEQIIRALQRPSPPLPEHPPSEPVGGALPLDSAFYIVRPTDEEFMAALGRRDCIVLVKGAGQMGKTSLLARGLQQAREAGDQVVLTDFQMFSPAHLTSGKALALTLAAGIADQLELPVLPEAVWSEHRSATVNLERYLRREVLGPLSARLVWGLDEVDRLFPYASANEVFGLFRSWHNRRALDPAGPWSRLTLALAYATEAHLFIADLNLSPFNVGTQVALEDFTPEQVEELNRRYQAPLRSAEEVERFYRLVNGQPHLVRRGLSELVKPGMDWATLEAQADGEEGPFGDHLRHLLVSLSRDAALTDIVRGLLRGEPCPTSESFYRLRSAGVIKGHSGSDFQFRCPLYQTYLERHLLGTSTGSSPTA
jgi:hypothetical protein